MFILVAKRERRFQFQGVAIKINFLSPLDSVIFDRCRMRIGWWPEWLVYILLLCLPIVGWAADFEYEISDDEVTITGYTGPGGDEEIPDRIEEMLVRHIGDSAFYRCSSLESVTIPDSVTTIGKWAFHRCTGLQSV